MGGIRRGGAVQIAYDAIKDSIIRGAAAPGDRLRELEIAEALGVSRTPIREALRMLHSDGLVRFAPNAGAQVAVFADEEVDEVFRLRARVDGEVGRLAAQRATESELAALRVVLARMSVAAQSTDSSESFAQVNREFHEGLTATVKSPRIAEARSSLLDLPFIRQTVLGYTSAMFARSIHHHDEVMDALEQHDPDWAEAAMTTHVLSVHAFIRRTRR